MTSPVNPLHAQLHLPSAWQAIADPFLRSPDAARLADFLHAEESAGHLLFPPKDQRFAALEALAPQDVKVVILGQDPYHGPGQAMGLSFSVPHGVAVPPSLVNIYKELTEDVGFVAPPHGDLTPWAQQGVLLLNSVLSVRAGDAGSHARRGWESLTDLLIAGVAAGPTPVVFMLWGSYAQKKAGSVDESRHLVLRAPHPSPLSAYRGFLGCRHFSLANAYLHATRQTQIDWQLPK
ncbi:uracil-DNA glycosylase [Salinispirillum sp. LH 10-3-1]|uniref:Uracil-DNA glycosylase n=1 Tax=Salinispirillum sp. LH 10-3-1 TaxID=2952525 RepID=A0AB38YHV2_9GAMM